MKNILLSVFVAAAFTPAVTFAYTATITSCADFRTFGAVTATCSSGAMSATAITSASGFGILGNGSGTGPFVSGTTYYYSGTNTGTNDLRVKVCDTGTYTAIPAGAFNITLMAAGCGSYSELTFTGTSGWTGTIQAGSVITDVPPTPPIPTGGATSTVSQTQENLSTAFYLFLLSMFGMIWLLRKH